MSEFILTKWLIKVYFNLFSICLFLLFLFHFGIFGCLVGFCLSFYQNIAQLQSGVADILGVQ